MTTKNKPEETKTITLTLSDFYLIDLALFGLYDNFSFRSQEPLLSNRTRTELKLVSTEIKKTQRKIDKKVRK